MCGCVCERDGVDLCVCERDGVDLCVGVCV